MPNPIRKYAYYLGSIFNLMTGLEDPQRIIRTFLRRTPQPMQTAGLQTVRLKQSGLKFAVRGTMDIWSVKETFLDRFYERCGTAVKDGWRVIDIGGGIGEFTIFAAAGRPAARVAAFEPFPQSYELLKQNLKTNGLEHVQIFAEAIGAEHGVLHLDLSGGEPLMIQSGAQSSLASSQTIETPCITLAEALDRLAFAECDLLKLDCEGAEYSILMDAPPAVLQRVKRIVMEYHDNAGPRKHTDLAAYLTQHGFRVRSETNAVHDHLGYLYAEKSAV